MDISRIVRLDINLIAKPLYWAVFLIQRIHLQPRWTLNMWILDID